MSQGRNIVVYTVELYMGELGTEVSMGSDITSWLLAGKDAYATDINLPRSMQRKAKIARIGKVRLLEGEQKEIDLECKSVHTEVNPSQEHRHISE